jgi:diketogulonate reductase-like aldo/keto reductase
MRFTRRQFILASAAAAAAGACGAFAAEAMQPSAMLKRKIPSTGEEIPVLGLGTYLALMTRDLNPDALALKAQVVKLLFDAGGRVIDTAPSYGNAEQVSGIVTTQLGLNDKLFMATKVLEDQGEQAGLLSYRRSLEHLKRDKLELMQCHNFIRWDEHFKTMRQWKEQGKFRYIGVTHFQDHAHEELERIIRRDKVDFLQMNYSVAEPNAAKRLLPAAKALGVATLINRPFAAGQILKRMNSKPLPDAMKPFAQSWAQALIKFVLTNDACTCVIGATGNPEHMRDNLKAGFGPLPDAQACRALRDAIA